MKPPTLTVRVPGKLFIAGEYAVLEPGGHSVVVAIDRYVYAHLIDSPEFVVNLPQIGFSKMSWSETDDGLHFCTYAPKLTFIQNAITVCHQYIRHVGIQVEPFSLTIDSELDDFATGKKYGLGSSAAVVVAVISAILQKHHAHGIPLSHEVIYKLAAIAHFTTQGSGSCADIAASTYGGWLHYRTFDAKWLIEQLEDGVDVHTLVAKQWPGLQATTIQPPADLELVVGWTGSEMSTVKMIDRIRALQTQRPHRYAAFIDQSTEAVLSMVKHFSANNLAGALQSLTANRNALKALSEELDAVIETPSLQALIQIANEYGAGKTSGAGGGDCGIALVSEKSFVDSLKREWRQAGIEPLNLTVCMEGTKRIEKGDLIV
ncbi:phosphomevalonate kinase [Sporosarcina saromensis]|uniref:phosphomevalonate kinase n=1 Tax=Sporosarcina saromensis TaxID=359365 RepID=A0ABU4GCT0_9BACL|nr:phosphomevalonate kinase [Sporosarcina saromensis]MDW0114796.1 phosphomevalonate kinase [Sporosarcina saromensis]